MLATTHKQLCQGCRTMKPARSFAHEYAGKIYCSEGCARKAMWLFFPAPRVGDAA